MQVTETSEEYELQSQLNEQLRSIVDKYKYKRRQIRELQDDMQVLCKLSRLFWVVFFKIRLRYDLRWKYTTYALSFCPHSHARKRIDLKLYAKRCVL